MVSSHTVRVGHILCHRNKTTRLIEVDQRTSCKYAYLGLDLLVKIQNCLPAKGESCSASVELGLFCSDKRLTEKWRMLPGMIQ